MSRRAKELAHSAAPPRVLRNRSPRVTLIGCTVVEKVEGQTGRDWVQFRSIRLSFVDQYGGPKSSKHCTTKYRQAASITTQQQKLFPERDAHFSSVSITTLLEKKGSLRFYIAP